MVENDVPSAVDIIYSGGTPAMGSRKTKLGTMINPPPMPNKPAKKPTNTPKKRQLNKIVILFSFLIMLMPRTIRLTSFSFIGFGRILRGFFISMGRSLATLNAWFLTGFIVSRFLNIVLQNLCKLFHRFAINISFKRDHLADWIPKADPTPAVKLRIFRGFQINQAFITD